MELRQAVLEIAAEHRLDAAALRRLERIAGLDDEPRERWAAARYGEFRVAPSGQALLVGLRGARLEQL